MRRVIILASAGALAFLAGGCSFFSFLPGIGDTDDIDGVVEEVPTPLEETPEQDFPEPIESGEQVGVEGLVAPTPPEERKRLLERGRQDPFSVIAVEPLLIPVEPEPGEVTPGEGTVSPGGGTVSPGGRTVADAGVPPVPSLPRPGDESPATPPTRTPGGGTGVAQGDGNGQPGGQPGQPGATPSPGGTQPPTGTPERTIPGLEPGIPGEEGIQAPLPPGEITPPQPAIASAIAVSGVIEVGTQPKAIIKAPNEDYSRYVQPGEYVSNGQVLVKRIEVGRGLYPTVVFEENGIEFARQVGAGGQAEEDSETPTAFISRSRGRV